MMIWKTAMWTSLGALTLGVLGCDVFLGGRARQDPVYVQQQPVYVDQQPQYVIVQQAPPALLVERRPAPPSADSIWIDGYWNWDSRRYNWQAGRYAVPPQRDVVWVAPRYEKDARGYRYTPGQWSKQNQGRGRGNGGN